MCAKLGILCSVHSTVFNVNVNDRGGFEMALTTFSSGVNTSFSSQLNENFKHNLQYDSSTTSTNPSVTFTPTSSSSVVVIMGTL